MTCVPRSRWGFRLPWHHGGLLPSSWDAGWVCGDAAFFLSTVPNSWGRSRPLPPVEWDIFPTQRVRDSLRLTWFVSDNWNFVFKRWFCQLTLGHFWRGLGYLLACEFMNHQPLKSVCCLLFACFLITLAPDFKMIAVWNLKRQSWRVLLVMSLPSAFSRSSQAYSWIFLKAD